MKCFYITPTSMASYLSGQIKNLVDLGIIKTKFIREAVRNGWIFLRQGKGSHEIYEKEGKQIVIPNNGAKEIGKGLEQKLRKEMGL